MNCCRICVAKIGGSLLLRPDLMPRLRSWLSTETSAHSDTHYVLLVGGGRLVDAVREIDAATSLGDANAHWICVALMDATSRIVSALLPELTTVDRLSWLLERTVQPGITLFSPQEFMADIEPNSPGIHLPADWSVTSDTIAARLAIVLGADELVFIKAAPPPISESTREEWLRDLATIGYVDQFLPSLSPEIPAVRFAMIDSS